MPRKKITGVDRVCDAWIDAFEKYLRHQQILMSFRFVDAFEKYLGYQQLLITYAQKPYLVILKLGPHVIWHFLCRTIKLTNLQNYKNAATKVIYKKNMKFRQN